MQAINGVIALQCIGIQDFYLGWIFEVFVIPGIILVMILLYYLYQRTVLTDGVAEADLTDRLFFLLFLTCEWATASSLLLSFVSSVVLCLNCLLRLQTRRSPIDSSPCSTVA